MPFCRASATASMAMPDTSNEKKRGEDPVLALVIRIDRIIATTTTMTTTNTTPITTLLRVRVSAPDDQVVALATHTDLTVTTRTTIANSSSLTEAVAPTKTRFSVSPSTSEGLVKVLAGIICRALHQGSRMKSRRRNASLCSSLAQRGRKDKEERRWDQ